MLFVEIKDLTSTDGSNTFAFFSCLDKAIQFANSSCGRYEFSAVDTDRCAVLVRLYMDERYRDAIEDYLQLMSTLGVNPGFDILEIGTTLRYCAGDG